ncbi:MAG TPA: SGNH/GDSL hydrolase family protein [Planctomycetota bacterium]|jgi:lysophospholipase L1-like esterase
MNARFAVLFLALFTLACPAEETWVGAMKAVHAKGIAQKGSVSQIGDSITYTKAFLAGLAWEKPKGNWDTLLGRIDRKAMNERKGVEHCNYSGWTAADGLSKIKTILSAEKPEIAVIMYGTNDVNKGVALSEYQKNMAALVDACLDAGCVPILSTIPPILSKDAKVAEFNVAIQKLASEKKIPCTDFHAEIIARQPGTGWNGTLLGKNDVHPSGGKNLDFSEENLKVCGYALRNFVACKAMQEVIEKCF